MAVGDYCSDETEEINKISNLPEVTKRPKKYLIRCLIDKHPITFEYDTGATVTTMSIDSFKRIDPNPNLTPTNLRLTTYTGEIIQVLGYVTVNIVYENQVAQGNVYLVKNNVRPIFGREWMSLITVQLKKTDMYHLEINNKCETELVHDLENQFSKLFGDDLGKIPKFKGQIKLRENTKPIFKKARSLPYAIKDKVENEIDKLERDGVISKVNFSQWGTPVVPIMKPGGQVRLCADYKISVNKVAEDESFPIPRQEDIFVNLSGGKVFTTLDIRKAYLHIEMDDDSSHIQSITTTKGVYRVNRLMFGVKSAPAIWQRVITEILQGISGIAVFYDDIIIQGSNLQENLARVKQVMNRLQDNNLRLNKDKCNFFKENVTYLGHVISKNGIGRCEEKTTGIAEGPQPKNVSELKSWLGIVNYYGKFIPNLSAKLSPLYRLLKKGAKFHWSTEAQKSFELVKHDMISNKLLIPYDENLPLILATDAVP